jgi:hypothetical protein
VRTEINLEMAASPREIYDLASDVSAWTRRLPHYRRSQVSGRFAGRVLVDFTAVRPLRGRLGIPVGWRAICWSDDSDPQDLRLYFSHVRGVTGGMRVAWHIRGTEAGGSNVTIEHDLERPLPIIGTQVIPRLVDRFFTHAIASRTLAAFRDLAERRNPGTARLTNDIP